VKTSKYFLEKNVLMKAEHMSFKNLPIKKFYSSDEDDILNDFYIPALKEARSYKRLTGFFSSSSMALAARGINGLLENEGNMKIITSPKLSKEDVRIILDSKVNPEKYIENKLLSVLGSLELENEQFILDHLYILGWMIANKRLQIKVAIISKEGLQKDLLDYTEVLQMGIFHQKIGILEDLEGNTITFSGSMNETACGWQSNIEEFKVFRSWQTSEIEYIQPDVNKFNKFWNNLSSSIRVIDIPEAVRNKLIEWAPKDINSINLKRWYTMRKKKKICLFENQKQAVQSWISNNMMGIFEMATGTGKTFTALGCLREVMKKEKYLLTVINCPFNHLVKQWQESIKNFGILSYIFIADSSIYNWKNKLMDQLYDLNCQIIDKMIILTTFDTSSSIDFINMIKKFKLPKMLISDEVHGFGSPSNRKGLLIDYKYRLGLSATPKRWFDLEGTEELFNYFGDTVYEFPLDKAVSTINPATGETYLTPYEYKPYFVELTLDEFERYEEETKKIAQNYYRIEDKNKKDNYYTILLNKRQEIVRDAKNKINIFKEILREIVDIRDCLVYCSPQQIETVQLILNNYEKKMVIQHKFTGEEGTKADEKYGGISEREFILNKFAQGEYHVLVAMKCLDEGVDVPSTKTAIILSSSGNPKQYIQRRGRVLRRFPNKDRAVIYDFIVLPPLINTINKDLLEIEKKILKNEFVRYKEFSVIAINSVNCFQRIEEIEKKYKFYL